MDAPDRFDQHCFGHLELQRLSAVQSMIPAVQLAVAAQTELIMSELEMKHQICEADMKLLKETLRANMVDKNDDEDAEDMSEDKEEDKEEEEEEPCRDVVIKYLQSLTIESDSEELFQIGKLICQSVTKEQ
jgi:hypothetical protein